MTTGILSGVRVLDLSRMLSGPYCTMMLADHGAEVIKIEGTTGDTSRNNGPFRDDDPEQNWAGYFVSLNRNKKSVQLNLKTRQGCEDFRRLANSADIIVENFRPGVMERLGLSYESLSADNPKLVYGAIRGFGDPRSGESPYANWPSYDVVAQAMGGVMGMTGFDPDTPTKVGPGIGDIFSGLMMSFAVITALRQAEATGKGQFVDVAMYDAMVSLCERGIYLQTMMGITSKPEGNGHPLLAPFGLFPAIDGAVALGIVDDAFWRNLTDAMGMPEIGNNPDYQTRAGRSKHADQINRIVADWTSKLTKEQLTGLLGGQVPFGPLNTMSDIIADPHLAARNMLVDIPHKDPSAQPWVVAANPVKFTTETDQPFRTPPALGEHNDDYLGSAAETPMSDDEKRALRDAFGTFATGVTVVTTRQEDGTPRGFTANSFTSVSLEPPLLLVCIAKSAASLNTFETSGHFAVNILSEAQKHVSGLFASKAPDKFQQVKWQTDKANVPLLDDALATFTCSRHRLVDAGDHVILIGRVIDHHCRDLKPLGFHNGSYFSIGLEASLVKAAHASGDIEIGAVMENDGKILLQKIGPDQWSLPKAPKDNISLAGLISELSRDKLTTVLNYLYAVYRDSDTGIHGIFYHGRVTGKPPESMRYFALDDLPFSQITNTAERSMLTRYREELRHGSFGIYQGDEMRGTVNMVAGRKPSITKSKETNHASRA